MSEIKHLFILIVILGNQTYTHCIIGCKNPHGKDVDWFIIYKIPKKTNFDTTGKEFFYMDNISRSFSYRDTPGITDVRENPLYETLKPIYSESSDVKSFAFYNDQNPPVHRTKRSEKAHSKGAVAFGRETGFWMVSSVPRFPAPALNRFEFLNPQTKYGQTVICVTINQAMIALIQKVFGVIDPLIYSEKMFTPEEVQLKSIMQDFATIRGTRLKVFAKSADFGKRDIYTYLISPGLENAVLFVLTWTNNLRQNRLVKKVYSVKFSNGVEFYATSDHSKWAVARDKPWTCIGDINRKKSQFTRGGLSLCLRDDAVAKEFKNLFARTKNRRRPKKVCKK